MKRDDWILLSLTFLTGLALGMYLYVMVFKPIYQPENLSNVEAGASEWSLVSKRRVDNDQTGQVQPSFRLLSDGGYVYLPGGASDNSLAPIEGKISKSLVQKIRSYDNNLSAYEGTANTSSCLNMNHEYRFTLSNQVYLLDSCYSALGYDSPLAEALDAVWDEVEGKGGSKPFTTPSQWVQNLIRQALWGE